MNSLLICFLGACSASLANLFFRKSADLSNTSSSQYFLLFFYLISLAVSLILYFLNGPVSFEPAMFAAGCLVGALNMSMMWFTAKALMIGPAGLTFTFQNASGVFPGLLLFSLFGSVYGFEITIIQLIGMGMIICGLYLGSSGSQQNKTAQAAVSLRWLKYALGCFLVQTAALTLIHWRCLLFAVGIPDHLLIPCTLDESSDAWFLPGQFGMACLLQLAVMRWQGYHICSRSEMTYGCLGGLANAATSLCLMAATKLALPYEKGLIFPCFAAGVMILCNLWANRLYGERFNMPANCCCTAGIFLSVA